MPIERLAVLAAVQSAKRPVDNNNKPGNGTTSESAASAAGAGGSNGHRHFDGYDDKNASNNGPGDGRTDTDLDESVNLLLGGAMMSGVIIFVVLLCYCCHRSVRKHRPREYSRYWHAQPDIVDTLQVFTTYSTCHGQQTAAVAATNQYHEAAAAAEEDEEAEEEVTIPLPCPSDGLGPPPTYDSLIFNPRRAAAVISSANDKKAESTSPRRGSRETTQVDVPKEANKSGGAETCTAISTAVFQENNEGLPSYEVALQLEANGYV